MSGRIPCLLLVLLGVSVPGRSQTETVLYSFGNTTTDGFYPVGGLVADGSGNLFGTTAEGSNTLCDLGEVLGCGIVYELVKSSNGYTEKVLYSFGTSSPISDGASPQAGLIMDAAGNLYGTTTYGGSPNCLVGIGVDGCGTVFELVKSSTGYTEQVLYTFTGFDGAIPLAGLIMDSAGNLYGTAEGGGAYGYGVVFELVNSSGTYTEKTLYSFGASSADGVGPVAGLLMDVAGNLYGTTTLDLGPLACGLSSCGTVFELVKTSDGYTERVLYQFTGADGAVPQAGLIMDASGNLYSTTSQGGAYGNGTVFELVNSSGTYTETVLYSFGSTASDGTDPVASLLLDASGNLYGTTKLGGSTTACSPVGCGTVFGLVNSPGSYTERLLHSFSGGSDGSNPTVALIKDSSGNLYSTTNVGGSGQKIGTVFTINPTAVAADATLSTTSLTFSNQLINTSSPAQTITVTNGKANLIFGPNAVTLSGGQPMDFAISTDLCSGTTVAPNATCTVSITFTPAIAATDNTTLTFFDNSVTSLQGVNLTGIGVLANSPVVALSPPNLTFSAQLAGTSSSPQTITLTNTGTAQLNISSIISTSGDFNQTNNCRASVSPGANCVISVSFTPTTGGPLTGGISIIDNSPGGSQGANLSGTGEDFIIGLATGLPQATISPEGSASFSLSATPTGGFRQTLTLGCSGAPSLATCSVPSSVTLDGTHAVSLMVNVTTTAGTLIAGSVPQPPFGLFGASVVYAFTLASLFALCLPAGNSQTLRLRLACLGVLLMAGVMCSSCGGGSSSSSSSPGTPAGTYTLTVTATSGNLTNSTEVTLIVK